MLVAAALVSSPPILVPELAGSAAQETADLRQATLDAGAALGRRARTWLAVGIGDALGTVPTTAAGTYAGFGADVVVTQSPDSPSTVDRLLPLTALTGAWVRTNAASQVRLEVRTVPAATDADDCRRYGLAVRAELDASDEPIGLLVIADGATTLTDKAPGSFHEDAPAVQATVDRALRTGDARSLAALDVETCREIGMNGRAIWQIAAAAMEPVSSATELYSGAPYGVGYFVGLWIP
ncbi:hypothetical protein GCM10007304_22740 [Rhodococcoides trifolii]|uniref:Uncharacterized protein n=1 Tax=Rhodococcoides trifolii TaxID=908250 RepID=A0A917FWN4_9NOCA|nr:hypothetical protein [Rhodococcus trifolii]GGG08089.1 hypothetical protein GCM10007304_22740 [Rhodococcus trifolii]